MCVCVCDVKISNEKLLQLQLANRILTTSFQPEYIFKIWKKKPAKMLNRKMNLGNFISSLTIYKFTSVFQW